MISDAAGRAAPIRPLVSTARLSAAHASHIQLRAVVDAARADGRPAQMFDSGAAKFDAAEDTLCAVDDVHLLNEEAQIAVFNLHNRIKAGNGTLLASGNAPPAQLKLRADLVTRLGAGLVYQVHGLNEEEKVAALKRHAQARGFQLSQEVIAYLLRHAQRDLPSLLALLDALDRYSLANRRAITLPLLRELLDVTAKQVETADKRR